MNWIEDNTVEVVEAFSDGNGFDFDEYRYMKHHRPDSKNNLKKVIGGVYVNPSLPEDFDSFPNDKRPIQETADWYNRAFIVTRTIVDSKNQDVYLSFDVRCLDGGASDRSTWKARTRDLKEAIKICNTINESFSQV